MNGGPNPTELEVEKVPSGRTRFQLARRPSTHRVADWKARPLKVMTFGCEALDDLEPRALGLTYWFDADADAEGEPYSVTIRFTGRRIGVKGKPSRRDSFSVLESIDHVLPGSGAIAITTRVSDVAPASGTSRPPPSGIHVTDPKPERPPPGGA